MEIKARIGMNAMYNYYPGEKMPLYEQPMVGDNGLNFVGTTC